MLGPSNHQHGRANGIPLSTSQEISRNATLTDRKQTNKPLDDSTYGRVAPSLFALRRWPHGPMQDQDRGNEQHC